MTINAIVGLGLGNIILSLSAAGWVVYARVVRGEVLAVNNLYGVASHIEWSPRADEKVWMYDTRVVAR